MFPNTKFYIKKMFGNTNRGTLNTTRGISPALNNNPKNNDQHIL